MTKSGKNILKISLTAAGAALLLVLFLAAALIWIQPVLWQRELATGFFQQHRSTVSVKSMHQGALGNIMLQEAVWGKSTQPIFQAPSGKIKLKRSRFFSAELPEIESVELNDVLIRIVQKKHNITFNGMTLDLLLSELKNLPRSRGKFIPVTLKGTISFNNQPPRSNCTLQIKYDEELNAFDFICSWQQPGKPDSKGSWNCRIDQKNNIVNAEMQGVFSDVVYQEILDRCSVPARLSGLLHKGSVSGSGKFTATLPDAKISNLEFNGIVSSGVLRWYRQLYRPGSDFAFSLKKTQRNIAVDIPQLNIKTPFSLELGDIKLRYRAGQNTVSASANCDLRQTAANFFCASMNCPEMKISASSDKLYARWDMQSGKWRINGTSDTSARQNALQLQNVQQLTLALTPERFEFKADGIGNVGKIYQQLDFRDLQLHNQYGKFSSDRGSFYLTANAGDKSSIASDILEFNFGNFSADTPVGQYDFSGFAGSVNMRNLPGKRKELYILARGNSAAVLQGEKSLNSRQWSCSATVESTGKYLSWNIADLVIQSPHIKYSSPDCGAVELNQLTALASGKLDNGKIATGNLQLKAELFRHPALTVSNGKLQINFDAAKGAENHFGWNAECQNAVFKKPFQHISKAENLKVSANTSSLFKRPDAIKIDSGALYANWNLFDLKIINSRINIAWDKSDNWNCTTQFSSLQADSQDRVYGSGVTGEGSVTIQAGKEYGSLKKAEIIAEINAPSWHVNELHGGSESLRGSIALEPDDPQKIATGNFELKNANIISSGFTVDAPDMRLTFTRNDRDVKGAIKFSNGTITSSNGELELRSTTLDMPWLAAGSKPLRLNEGKLTSGEVRFKQQNEGSFSGKLKHCMLLTPQKLINEHKLTLEGTLEAAAFNRAPVRISSQWQLPPEKSQSIWHVELPESTIAQPIELNKYLPLAWPCTMLKGSVSSVIDLQCSENAPATGSLNIKYANADCQAGALTLEGLTGDFRAELAGKTLWFEPCDLLISRILWQKWVFSANQLQIALSRDNLLHLNRWQGDFMTGKIDLSEPLQLNINELDKKTTIKLKFKAKNLHSGEFFKLLKIDYIVSDMMLNGSLNVCCDLTNNKIYFDPSQLQKSDSKPALLRVTPPDNRMIKIADSNYRDFTLAVIKAMHCSQSAFDFTLQPGEVTIKVSAEGAPERPVPFVYQGSSSKQPFRPAEPGESGFSGVLELNVNLKLHPEDPGI